MQPIILDNSDESIKYAINSLKKGNIGIFPTDTVYGIGCDALNINAVNKLYIAKKRNLNNPINILVSNINMVKKFVISINKIEEKLINEFWPGDLTIVFEKSNIVPDILTANLNTVGIRMPNNKVCLDIIDRFGSPVATSSANIAGYEPYTNINDNIINDFKDSVNFIIDNGKTYSGVPSTIVKVQKNFVKILRIGSISTEDISRVLGGKINVR